MSSKTPASRRSRELKANAEKQETDTNKSPTIKNIFHILVKLHRLWNLVDLQNDAVPVGQLAGLHRSKVKHKV